jgi:CRISPR/Cas system CSM-associated protein Csm4 (group 5 of RAMP superfamily)
MSYGQAIGVEPEYSANYEQSPKKIKRPGFLARWFFKKLLEGAELEKRQMQERESAKSIDRLSNSLTIGRSSQTSIDQPERALNFTIYVANGGRVVETRRYDKKTDRHTNGLYVINNDADFGKEIDKIITMESLR